MADTKSFRIKKGLDVPITGQPVQEIEVAPQPPFVAVMAADYVGMKPTMYVQAGDTVKRGQLLFEDKKTPGVRYTAPGAGTVAAVNRGDRRALQSVVIALSDAEKAGSGAEEEVSYEAYTGKDIAGMSRDEIKALLVETGMWPSFRTRPFSKVPSPEAQPHSIFVTAMDTNPLAPSVEKVLKGQQEDFERGLIAVAKLTDGLTYLCKEAGSGVSVNPNSGVTMTEFSGPHPAGTVGLHIHLLDPVHREKTVWHINYQEVVAIGSLIRTGKLSLERVVALCGPVVEKPRLLRTRLGASVDALVDGELEEGDNRVVAGSVLNGRAAQGEVHGYLGRFHHQITALREGKEREMMGWMTPGFNKFSTVNVFVSKLMPGKRFDFNTSTNGSKRAMVPIGMYERVMPLDIMPTHLLRSLAVKDVEKAEQLGCLELDEEDLALCSFVCPGKINYGPILRENLELIEKEG